MKLFYSTSFACVSFLSSFSQKQLNDTIPLHRWQFTAGIGSAYMTGLPGSMDRQYSYGIKYDFNYNISLVKHHYLTLGVGFQSENYIVDGVFTHTGNDYHFVNTPDNYKQNEISIEYLQFPLLYKYQFFGSSVSFGPYAAVVLNSNNNYKIQTTNYEDYMPIENNFLMGLQLDLQWYFPRPRLQNKTSFLFGLGAQYQLSEYLSDQRSFKPFIAYFKVGVSIK